MLSRGRQNRDRQYYRRPLARYYRSEARQDKESPFQRKAPAKRPWRFLIGAVDVVLGIIVLIALGYSLMLQPKAKIVADNQLYRSASEYEKAVDTQLGSLQNRNKITFSESSLVAFIKKQFPEVTGVTVELPFLAQRPVVRLSVAKPSFYLLSQDKKYVVGANGVAIAEAQQAPRVKGLVTVTDQSGFQAKPGALVLSAASTSFVNNLVAQCNYAKVPLASLTLPAVPQELHLRTTDQSYYVKFYLGGDATEEAGQFLAARKHFQQSNSYPSQYLDARVAGRVFYK